jgi:hypothetical protein
VKVNTGCGGASVHSIQHRSRSVLPPSGDIQRFVPSGDIESIVASGDIESIVDPANFVPIAGHDLGELLGVETADLAVETQRAVLFRYAD